ncbi:hypothetical protein LOM8899_04591 [Flavimaricola marinus]|uniref:Integrase catalytic domain-containing protein n=1 Tax=Flavimaricola marinus TaxID=1819565 RepID=A0A238LL79_9RHOB|nr:hypothetical protein LOM8899_04591 [Flavimaricola marinus]
MPMPERPNERWRRDLVSDAFTDGRMFRGFAIVDDFSRECLAFVADVALGVRVIRDLTKAMARGGRPQNDCQRQWDGKNLHGRAQMMPCDPDGLALHRAR